MPIRLETPMFFVHVEKMRKVDTRNAEHLFGLYSGMSPVSIAVPFDLLIIPSVFSKCADSMEDGRRLENLSWRIWNRETLCCEPQPQLATTPAIEISRARPGRKDVPKLSTSVDSIASAQSVTPPESQRLTTAPLDIRTSAAPKPEFTVATNRGKEKHITSLGLEKMVCSIQDKQELEPLSPSIADAIPPILPPADIIPQPRSPPLSATFRSSHSSSSTAPLSSSESEKSARQTVGSDTSSELVISHSVVRGFSPNRVSSSYRSHTKLAPASPIPTKSAPYKKSVDTKRSGVFMLGGGSLGEGDSSSDDRMESHVKHSSLAAGLKLPLRNKKHLSFKDEIEARTLDNKSHEDEEVFESDSEDEIEDSAIDDDSEDEDDDEDWEDDASESVENMMNDKPLFQRVDSQPNLVSRRSLLTSLMSQSDRAAAFEDLATKSTPVRRRCRNMVTSGASTGKSPKQDHLLAMGGPHMTPSKPMIVTTSNTHQMALSPRTTRRNFLASEMTESLRKHVLWERQQKKQTANAVLKRRHTAHDVTNLQHYPEETKGQIFKQESRNNSWNNPNNYFGQGLGEYHEAGW